MASKKRSSGKGRTRRKGLSGNPQRRAAQLASGAWARTEALPPETQRPGAPWWPESHERVLAVARASAWPSRVLDVETLAGGIIGDEFYGRMNAGGPGLHPGRWLTALATVTRKELLTAIQNDTPDAPQLLSLLLGLMLIAPRMIPFSTSAENRLFELVMPLIEESYETGQVLAAESLAEYATDAWSGKVPDQARRGGDPVFARDAYGSRLLVAAPFGHDGSQAAVEVDHWYAWDIDMCGLDVVVGARVSGSAEEALAEWRDAVGASASAAALAPCPEEILPVLLNSALDMGDSTDVLDGGEPRELIREYHRKVQRARAVAWHKGITVGEGYDPAPAVEEFQEWHAARHPSDVPSDLGQTLVSILENWGPFRYPDAVTFYACSPHRLEYVAVLLRDGFIAEDANKALRLLPEWTRWCLSRSEIGEDSEWGARAMEAAHAEAEVLVDEGDASPVVDDEGPFRRAE